MDPAPKIQLVEVKGSRLMRAGPADPAEVTAALDSMFPGYGLEEVQSPTSVIATERVAVPIHQSLEVNDKSGKKLATAALGSTQVRVAVTGGYLQTLTVSGEFAYRSDISQATWADRRSRPGTIDLASGKLQKPDNLERLGRELAFGSASGGQDLFANLFGELEDQSRASGLVGGESSPLRMSPLRLRVVIVSGGRSPGIELRGLGQGWKGTGRNGESSVLVNLGTTDCNYSEAVVMAEYLAIRVLAVRALEATADQLRGGSGRRVDRQALTDLLLSDAFLGPYHCPAGVSEAVERSLHLIADAAFLDDRLERTWNRIRLLAAPPTSMD